MQLIIEVLPEKAGPLYDSNNTPFFALDGFGQPLKIHEIGNDSVLVPLFPISLGMLNFIPKIAELGEKHKCEYFVMVFNNDRTKMNFFVR